MFNRVSFNVDDSTNIKITYAQFVRNNLQLSTANHPEVMQKFDDCMTIWKVVYAQKDAELALILRAVDYAAEMHRGQMRRNAPGTPFILHPLSMAEILSSVGEIQDAKVIACAILHHILSDELGTSQELEQLFGNEVKEILVEANDEPNFNRASDDDRMIVINRAPTLSVHSQLLKLAGMLDHARHAAKNRPEIVWEQKLLDQMPNTNPYLFQAVQRELH
jgi:(p)ppGpp synthase/HD superfamily hydrolase